jgi:hypothetical protein
MDWNWGEAGEGAAAGAAAGSFVPGIGTVAGGAVGGVMGGMGLLDAEDVDSFDAPTLTPAQQFEQQYTGTFDPVGGAGQVLDTERKLGITAFNPERYTTKLEGGLRANVDEGTKAMRAARGNRMATSGFLNSGTARALDENAIGLGERTFAMGAADIAQDSAGKQLEEAARRMGYATDYGKTNLANDQFSFTSALEAAEFNEGQRQADNAMEYGIDLDQYQLNELDPAERQDALDAGLLQAGASVVGAGIGAGGTVAGGMTRPRAGR